MKLRPLVIIVLIAVLLTACSVQPAPEQNEINKVPPNFTRLPAPNEARVSLYRSVEDNIVCYFLWGGPGVDISCPSIPKDFAEDILGITITDLGKPEGILHARVYKIQDGDQICFLSIGGTDVSLSCP